MWPITKHHWGANQNKPRNNTSSLVGMLKGMSKGDKVNIKKIMPKTITRPPNTSLLFPSVDSQGHNITKRQVTEGELFKL